MNEDIKYGIVLDDLRPIARRVVGRDAFDYYDDILQELASIYTWRNFPVTAT